MNKTNFIKALKKLNACNDALNWVRKTPGTPAKLYQSCQRGAWLMWLVNRSWVEIDWAEYWKQYDRIWAKFEGAKYEQKRAELIRSMVSFEDIEKALEGLTK